MARLTRIKIQNYRSIKDSGDIAITKMFALIGRNNTGKSSFLKAIQILFGDIKDVEISDFHKGTDDPIKINGTIKTWIDGQEKNLVIEVTCKKTENPKYSIDGVNTTYKDYIKSIPPLLVIPDRRDLAEFSTAGNKSTLLKKILAERKDTNKGELEAISKKLEEAKRNEAISVSALITKKFREVAQEQAFEVKIEPDIDIEKSTTHKSTLVDSDIPNAPIVGVTESGTGVQSMYLLTLLDVYGDISKKSDDAILVIEEPEVYLHPDYQRRMFEAMRKIASDNQVIYSTHSPIMVSEIWLTESVRQIRLKDGETKIEDVKIEDVISELGIRYEDVLNPRLTIFVEGKTDINFYGKLGFEANDKIAFITTDGFQAMHYFAYIKIISSENVSSTFVAIADGDGEDPQKRKNDFRGEIEKQFRNPSGKMLNYIKDQNCFLILSKYSIESYFLTVETLSCAFPSISRSDLEKFLKHYETVYKEQSSSIKDANTLKQFQQYARPKLIFDRSERKGDNNPSFEKAYYSFWKDDEDFKRTREQIIVECEKLRESGGWFDFVLSKANLEEFDDLMAIRNDINKLVS